MHFKTWMSFCVTLALGTPLGAQCFDLSSTHLYQPDGRFIEQWDQPIWNAAPGEGKFHLDQQEYGKHPLHFALFMGMAKKTEAGWAPFKRVRYPKPYCDHSGPRGSLHCWLTPYEKPSPGATPAPPSHEEEMWSLNKAGQLKYVYKSRVPEHDGESGTEEAVATLNLENGHYEMSIHGHGKGIHSWAVKGGVELWRNITFTAQAKLTPAACPATLEKVSAQEVSQTPKTVEMEGLRPCVIKVKPQSAGSRARYEFIQNPMNATSPQGCVVVHEEPLPNGEKQLAVGGK